MPDVEFCNHGSIATLRPLTEAAHQWMDEHIPDDAQWFGGALAVEGRYVNAIIDGMFDDGLTIA